MADDLTKRAPQDGKYVNVNEPYEVRYWCEKFTTTEAKLRKAVAAVGPLAVSVEIYLKMTG